VATIRSQRRPWRAKASAFSSRNSSIWTATARLILSIYPGLGNGEFALEPAEVVQVAATGQVQAIDLDGKGRADVLLHYPQTLGHRSEIVVLVNRGAW
jgi:hypothetical protein